MRRRQLVDLDGMAMAVFTFAGGVLIGTGGSWQNALSVGSLFLGLAFMARLLRSETGDVWSRPLYEKPDRRPSPELQETLDGVLEAIEEEDARRQAKRQRLLVFLAPLEAAQREQGAPSGAGRGTDRASAPSGTGDLESAGRTWRRRR